MYDPRERLIQAIAATKRQKGRKMRTRQKDAYSSDQDLRQVLQMTVDELTNQLRSTDLDLHDVAETLANAVGPVMDAIDDDTAENGSIEDSADGAVVRLGKDTVYSPEYDSVLMNNPERPKLFDAIKKSINNFDPFWGVGVEEE